MNSDSQQMKELLLVLTRALVNEPDEINIQVSEHGNTVVLELTCNPSDMGKVIGRGGKRAQAIRTLMKAKAAQSGRRVVVDFAG